MKTVKLLAHLITRLPNDWLSRYHMDHPRGIPNEDDVVVENTATDTISYTGNWIASVATLYHGGSMHISFDNAASVSFAFTGERFWYYSDLNIDHGDCSISVDGVIVQPSLSTYNATLQHSQLIYGHIVEPGSHTVEITSLDVGKAFTIDYFMYRQVSNEAPNSKDIVLRPDSASITYAPISGAWSSNGSQTPGYRETNQQSAYFSFTFEGTYVWFQWTRNFDHGVYSVSVDGGVSSRFSAYSPEFTSPMILYSRALDPGYHTITFTNVQAGGNRLGADALFYRPIPRTALQSRIATQTLISNVATLSQSFRTSSTATPLVATSLSISSSPSPSMSFAPTSNQGPSPVATSNDSRILVASVVLGSVVCIVFVMLAVIFVLRRQRSGRPPAPVPKGASNADTPDAEVDSADSSPTHDRILPWVYNGEEDASYPVLERLPKYSERQSMDHGMSPPQEAVVVGRPKLRSKN